MWLFSKKKRKVMLKCKTKAKNVAYAMLQINWRCLNEEKIKLEKE